jgi:NarL family two-component system sensor histidine kinase LiaS
MVISGAVAGVLFGYLISRGLTRRLRLLARAADDWSQGEFSTLARDTSGDEIGQLARHLNHMAVELQSVLQTRQELATLEERNRLARELHDSVKQQVFATAMQVGAARALIEQNPDASKENLAEAEQLVRQAQQELTTLIRELRPAALKGKGLARALQDCVSDWSRQSHITAELRVRGERPLPLPLEQALFRVAQEALTNISRHSQATSVEVELVWENGDIILSIADNGHGFNVSSTDGKGLGLQSMRERVEALGGQLEVKSKPGTGTRIQARLKTMG